MTTKHQGFQIRLRHCELSWAQIASIKEQQDKRDPWQTSPINILHMPNSSAQPPRSRATVPFHPVEPPALDPKIKGLLQQIEEIEQKIPPTRRMKAKVLCPVIQANQEAVRLGLENAPSRWCGGRDGWILWTRYDPCSLLARRKVEKEQLPVSISTLRIDEQCIAYHRLHQVATPAQLAKYYRLHCAQLDEMRYLLVFDRLMYFKDRRKMEHAARPVQSCRGDHRASAEGPTTRRVLLSDVEVKLRGSYKALMVTRAYAHGLEALVEGCEALLRRQQQSEEFTAIDWRPFTSRTRWRDGRRGWTGLSEEEVRTDVVEVRSRDVRSKTVPIHVTKAVFRAQFARFFPRAADKRICAKDGETDT
ncbi:MAG: hypothetical protein ASARMPRED_009411 [Alectoria sarmentosa]|nr:MAG: hypothetical protein ASARMPRED_009411 [Alectoria sarmentosa]